MSGWCLALTGVACDRGGGELGREWYRQGCQLNKHNSFHDFVACAEHLVSSGYTSPSRLVAKGSSAGGLLIGTLDRGLHASSMYHVRVR